MTTPASDELGTLLHAKSLGAGDLRGTRILAKTIYRELRASGLAERDVLGLATQLLALVAEEMSGGPSSDSHGSAE